MDEEREPCEGTQGPPDIENAPAKDKCKGRAENDSNCCPSEEENEDN